MGHKRLMDDNGALGQNVMKGIVGSPYFKADDIMPESDGWYKLGIFVSYFISNMTLPDQSPILFEWTSFNVLKSHVVG